MTDAAGQDHRDPADGTGEHRDDRRFVVGIDIGGTKTALLATDVSSGDDLGQERYETDPDAGVDAALDALGNGVDALARGCGRDVADLAAMGLAVPGLVDVGSGRVIAAGNLAGWRDLPLRDLLARRFGVPVFVDQDANAGAVGEQWRGGAREMNTFAFLALGTGVGAGLVIDGRLHRGVHHGAGELGNLVVGRQFLGRRALDGVGNLAHLVGGKTVRRRAARAAGEPLSAAEAIDRAEDDEHLAPIADDVVEYVAMAVVALGSVLDPEAIFLGGGTAEAGDALLARVRILAESELPAPPLIACSHLGADAQLHGAVYAALHALDPALPLLREPAQSAIHAALPAAGGRASGRYAIH